MQTAALLLSLCVAQDYMKMMKPYEESPEDLAVAKQLLVIDQAIGAQDGEAADAALAKLRAMKPKKQLAALMKSKEPLRRALTVMGMRLLPLKRMWDDLRYMLMDSSAPVRAQVLMYAAEQPQGIDLDAITMSMSDADPNVRLATITAVMKVARKKERAEELFRMRLKEEKEPMIVQRLKAALTVLGSP